MKKLLLPLCFVVASFSALAEDNSLSFEFDFANPTTLTPSVEEPGQKQSVPLDGYTFTNGDVAVSFAATGTGNTQVRLYGSYDAGCDLRLYDGDTMTVTSLNDAYKLDNITFEISLSGGSSDVDLDPSCGEYDWLNTMWTANGEDVYEVELVSIQQSRMTKMVVTLSNNEDVSGISLLTPSDMNATTAYYNLQGEKVIAPSLPGIYIRRSGATTTKIFIR